MTEKRLKEDYAIGICTLDFCRTPGGAEKIPISEGNMKKKIAETFVLICNMITLNI